MEGARSHQPLCRRRPIGHWQSITHRRHLHGGGSVRSICGVATSRLKQMEFMLQRATEFRLIHTREHERISVILRIIQYTSLVISSVVTMLLLGFQSTPWVAPACSVSSISMGILVSWSRFQNFEVRCEGHLVASHEFEGLARGMETYLSTVTPEQLDGASMEVLRHYFQVYMI